MQNDINSDRRVVLSLGMDGTGTCVCTNVVNILGMRLSPRLLPADQFNETGYFEDPEIFQAHVQILAALDRSWETLETIHPYPSRWWESPSIDPLRAALVDIVRRRSVEGPGGWGFKNPSTAAFWPLWNERFQMT